MAILWKPTGTLDINTAPTDLPEQAGNGGILSGAMVRCKNLRLDRHGIAQLRYGSSLVSSFTPTSAPELILEVGGHRYIFAGSQVFYDETEVSEAVVCADPVFTPDGGSYTVAQTVTITCATARAEIYYTLTNTTPNAQSAKYTAAITVPVNTYLKAIAIDPLGVYTSSSVVTAYYSLLAQDVLVTETNGDTLVTETDSDTITSEGP